MIRYRTLDPSDSTSWREIVYTSKILIFAITLGTYNKIKKFSCDKRRVIFKQFLLAKKANSSKLLNYYQIL